LEKSVPARQANSLPAGRIADSSSINAVSFSSARTTNRFRRRGVHLQQRSIPLPKCRMIRHNSRYGASKPVVEEGRPIETSPSPVTDYAEVLTTIRLHGNRTPFQRERIDKTLRTTLWNVLSLCMWNKWEPFSEYVTDHYGYNADSQRINSISKRLWLHYFKRDIDDLPEFKGHGGQRGAYDFFKEYFFSSKWYEVYDFIEFVIQVTDTLIDAEAIEFLNAALEKENAAYRIVGGEAVEITDTNEIKAIEDALNHPDAPVREHIRTALAMLSDRGKPDYRNSIKEAISAVEATCRLVTGMKSATLGDALKRIPDLHRALQKSFLELYGFSSDASGIRHSLLEEPNLTYADAKFMLTVCSAFVSYLRSNANKA
jgi:AbiJ N-terminal domain 4